jgi:type IX secretion system PorP/SprF family membrane protein
VSRSLTMRAGIQATFMQRSYDFSRFRFGDQIDDRYGFIYQTSEQMGAQVIRFPNFSFGYLAYTKTFFGGLAVHNITEPNQSFYFASSGKEEYKLPRRFTGHAGINIPLTNQRDEDERVMLSPNVLFMTQRNYNQLNLGFYLKKQALTTGLWFRQTSRNSDAVILLVGLKYTRFRIGYSYDITVSGARTVTQGSHELSLSFEIPKRKREKRAFKALTCPDF